MLLTGNAAAQLVLTGTGYVQDFSALGGGLPAGWSVSTGATVSTLGSVATFQSAPTDWSASLSGEPLHFRNIAGPTLATNASGAAQAAATDRALGWRPGNAASREGTVTLLLADTAGFANFALSLTLFTANSVANDQAYVVEYRIGALGDFTSLGTTYTTGAPFNTATFTADGPGLAALDDQPDVVYLRVRGITASGTSASGLDTVGIDNFTLTYSAVPEPGTWGVLAGLVALAGVARRRHLWRGGNAAEVQPDGIVKISVGQRACARSGSRPQAG